MDDEDARVLRRAAAATPARALFPTSALRTGLPFPASIFSARLQTSRACRRPDADIFFFRSTV